MEHGAPAVALQVEYHGGRNTNSSINQLARVNGPKTDPTSQKTIIRSRALHSVIPVAALYARRCEVPSAYPRAPGGDGFRAQGAKGNKRLAAARTHREK